VLVLTMSTAPAMVSSAVRAGAQGYVVKGAGGPELLAAVRTVAAGGMAFGGAASAAVEALLAEGNGAAKPVQQLSEREREVLDEIARGANNADIARRLGLSDKTVRNYVSSLHTKLGVTDRGKLVVLGRDAGLGR
jgi:DNA-binding NarL/FixJ family response regulator